MTNDAFDTGRQLGCHKQHHSEGHDADGGQVYLFREGIQIDGQGVAPPHDHEHDCGNYEQGERAPVAVFAQCGHPASL